MKLSIIIVNYNVQFFLEQCIKSALKAIDGMKAEIIVIDNNSVDGSMAMMRNSFPHIKCIVNKDNRGFSVANNQGIKIASGEYILLLNPDTVVEEDTFKKCIEFMDSHPEAGGLGVKMIDGAGKFLPESKRGLPTPSVAFYKIFGLASLFPKSKTFGKYHLSYLDKDEIHEVEILAGAYMLMRKKVLDQIGYLDEAFFMYGEDIDLSYRIIKAGFKNYYFPNTSIIHYKGESTKKSSVNYVLVFYNAMIIFAKKHFSSHHANSFTALIKFAVYIRAFLALVKQWLEKYFIVLVDAALIFMLMWLLKGYWSTRASIHYPVTYLQFAAPAYIILWLGAIFLSGGYDKPIKLSKIFYGIFIGTIAILVVYALLPESYRFSRALILLGALGSAFAMSSLRMLLHTLKVKPFLLYTSQFKRLAIVGDESEGVRVLDVLKKSATNISFLGFVNINQQEPKSESYQVQVLGQFENLKEIIQIYQIDEIIFCAKDLSSQEIISSMSNSVVKETEFKIAPPESLFIIGSNSIDNPGEFYAIDLNRINSISNKRNKRLLDLISSIFILIFSPVLMLVQKNPIRIWQNCILTLAGKRTWIGYCNSSNTSAMPKIKKGVVDQSHIHPHLILDDVTKNRLNTLYAKNYSVFDDLVLLFKAIRLLGS
ncbi:MAG: hypothetical protein RIQ89_508 [Bacteroidota bacterium]